MSEEQDMAFTPGPWAVDDMHTCSVWSSDADPIKVAETKGVRQAGCYRTPDDSEREANARLIAAAPEQHKALQAVKAYYIDANPTKLTEAYVCDLVCNALAKASAQNMSGPSHE